MTTSFFCSIAHFSTACELQKANSESQCLNFDRLTIWCVQIMKICAISDVWWRFAISLAGHKVWVNITFCFMQHAIDENQWQLPVHCCSSCSRCMSLMAFIPNLRLFFFLTMLTTSCLISSAKVSRTQVWPLDSVLSISKCVTESCIWLNESCSQSRDVSLFILHIAKPSVAPWSLNLKGSAHCSS